MANGQWRSSTIQRTPGGDKDQLEVAVVIARGRRVWGVEVKAGTAVISADGRGPCRLAGGAGRNFQHGIVVYGGSSTLPTTDPRVMAVPPSGLWTR